MKTYTRMLGVFLFFALVWNTASVFAVEEDDETVVKQKVGVIRNVSQEITNVTAETQRGVIGTILLKIFSQDGTIWSKYIHGFSEILGNTDGIVPRWNNNRFQIGSIRDDGTDVSMSGDLSVSGTITAGDFAKADGTNVGGKFVDGVNSNYAVYTDGRVGIGTDSPVTLLDVTGNIWSRKTLYVGDSGNGNSIVNFHDDNSDVWRSIFWNDSANRFEVENNGGTYDELMVAGVTGDLIQDNTIDSSEIQNNSLTGQDILDGSIASADIADSLSFSDITISSTVSDVNPGQGQVRVYNSNSTSTGADASILLQTKGLNAGDPYISFDIANEAGWSLGADNDDGNKFKLSKIWNGFADPTRTLLTIARNGKVGIGLDDPSFKLDVSGGVRATGNVRANGFCDINGDNCITREYIESLVSGSVPEGAIIAFNTNSCPIGWDIYEPAQGRFLRGIDTNSANGTLDPDGYRSAGSTQSDAMQRLTGSFGGGYGTTNWADGIFYRFSDSKRLADGSSVRTTGSVAFDSSRQSRTSSETRPTNVGVLYCVKNASSSNSVTPATKAIDLDSTANFNPHCSYKWVNSSGYSGKESSFTAMLVTTDMLWWRQGSYDSAIVNKSNKRVQTGQYAGAVTAIYETCP